MAAEDGVKGLVVGALVGIALGLLYAPKSGKETRENICNSTEDLLEKTKACYDQARAKVEKLMCSEKESYIGKRERLKKALKVGIEAYKEEKSPLQA